MKILDINSDSYKKELENFGGTVLIDFFAPWCAPCKAMAPVIDSIAQNAGEDFKICKVNVENEKELASKFGIMSIPTLVVMKNGEIKNRSIGVTGKKAILDMIN